jgi:hypothetical protein
MVKYVLGVGGEYVKTATKQEISFENKAMDAFGLSTEKSIEDSMDEYFNSPGSNHFEKAERDERGRFAKGGKIEDDTTCKPE